MVVYVDDFILIAPKGVDDQIWAQLDKHITFKDPAIQVNRFLGVHHHINTLKDGTCTMLTEASEYLKSAVNEYQKETGIKQLAWVP